VGQRAIRTACAAGGICFLPAQLSSPRVVVSKFAFTSILPTTQISVKRHTDQVSVLTFYLCFDRFRQADSSKRDRTVDSVWGWRTAVELHGGTVMHKPRGKQSSILCKSTAVAVAREQALQSNSTITKNEVFEQPASLDYGCSSWMMGQTHFTQVADRDWDSTGGSSAVLR